MDRRDVAIKVVQIILSDPALRSGRSADEIAHEAFRYADAFMAAERAARTEKFSPNRDCASEEFSTLRDKQPTEQREVRRPISETKS